jgi:hypothetical protein
LLNRSRGLFPLSNGCEVVNPSVNSTLPIAGYSCWTRDEIAGIASHVTGES